MDEGRKEREGMEMGESRVREGDSCLCDPLLQIAPNSWICHCCILVGWVQERSGKPPWFHAQFSYIEVTF